MKIRRVVLLSLQLVSVSLASIRDSLDGLKKVQPIIGTDSFDVMNDYNAKGDGETDDTSALQAAFDDCAASQNGGGVIKLAEGYDFLSLPLTLSGSGCALEVKGKLRQKFWPPSSDSSEDPDAFIVARDITDFLIYGGGTIDGNGPEWWGKYDARPKILDVKATNVALYDVLFYNAPNHNLEMYSDSTEIAYVNISVDWYAYDGNAPNTDGIDVHGSPFYIHDCHIDVGDDNIAIHDSDLLVENCIFGSSDGPENAVHGHGVSIGSVGSNNFISNLTIRNSVFLNTHVGPNCKIHGDATNGHIYDVLYENLYIDSAQLQGMRINVDYSLSTEASTKKSKPFVLNDFTYRNITIVNTDVPGEFICSNNKPCLDIHFIDIDAQENTEEDWECAHIYGTQDNVSPKLCLQSGFPSSYSYSFSYPLDNSEYGERLVDKTDPPAFPDYSSPVSFVPPSYTPRLRRTDRTENNAPLTAIA